MLKVFTCLCEAISFSEVGEKDFFAYLTFLHFAFGVKDVPLKMRHYRIAKIWNSKSKYVLQLLGWNGPNLFFFFLNLQNSAASLLQVNILLRGWGSCKLPKERRRMAQCTFSFIHWWFWLTRLNGILHFTQDRRQVMFGSIFAFQRTLNSLGLAHIPTPQQIIEKACLHVQNDPWPF